MRSMSAPYPETTCAAGGSALGSSSYNEQPWSYILTTKDQQEEFTKVYSQVNRYRPRIFRSNDLPVK